MPMESRGPAAWSSATWLAEATAWLDARLRDARITRTGAVEQPHLRPWSTVLRAPTTSGPVWLKAPGPGTTFEVGLYATLERLAPRDVLVPIAVDLERSWVLLPDGGPSLEDRLEGEPLAQGLIGALEQYGELQRRLAPHAVALLGLGVTDMRPAVMPERFEQALDVGASIATSHGSDEDRRRLAEVAALRPVVRAWCDELAASALPASLDHNDLHEGNVLGDPAGRMRFYDWCDSVVAHALAAAFVPLRVIRQLLGVPSDDPTFLAARDRYLRVFAADAPGEDLVRTLELACRVARIARVLTWDRAVSVARESGDPVGEEWVTAPLQTLLPMLDASYLGGR